MPKRTIFLPFCIPQLVKSLLFYIPEAWYPFRAEPSCIGHCRVYPPPPPLGEISYLKNSDPLSISRTPGLQGQGKVDFIQSQGVSKPLFKVSEKSENFILRLPQISLLHVFLYRKGNVVLKIIGAILIFVDSWPE